MLTLCQMEVVMARTNHPKSKSSTRPPECPKRKGLLSNQAVRVGLYVVVQPSPAESFVG